MDRIVLLELCVAQMTIGISKMTDAVSRAVPNAPNNFYILLFSSVRSNLFVSQGKCSTHERTTGKGNLSRKLCSICVEMMTVIELTRRFSYVCPAVEIDDRHDKGGIVNRIRYLFRNFELPLVKFPGALGSVLLLGVIDSTRLDSTNKRW